MVKLGYMTNAFGELVGAGGGVTSMKDVGYLTMGSDEEAIKTIASKGYSCIEIFEGNILNYESDPEKLLAICKKYGISILGICVGCHFIYEDALEDELYKVNRVSALAKKLGAKHIAFCGGAIRGRGIQEEDYELLGKGVNQAAKVVRSHGLEAHFHPHLGSLAENPEQINKLFSLTDVLFCADTAHLAAGGGDPLAMIQKYYDRIHYVHLKDLNEKGEFVPLGMGTLDLEAIIDFLKSKGYAGDWLVECDGYAGDAVEACEISYHYLEGKL